MYTVHAESLSRLAFAGHVSALHIRRKHGILPLTMAFREQEQEEQLWRQVDQGERGAIRSLIGGGMTSVLTSSTFKHCLECTREQEANVGVGHWMTLHQIAGVARCIDHGAPLMDQCADCGAGLGGPLVPSLPSDPCVHCGGTKRRSTGASGAPAQQSYVALVSAALNGEASDLRPSTRRLLLSQARSLVGSNERIAKELLKAWGADDTSDLAAHLECEVRSDVLAMAIAGGHLHGVPRPLVMAIVAFCRDVVGSHSDARRTLSEQFELVQEAQSLSQEQDELLELLKGIAPVNYPLVALRAFAQGRTLADVTHDRLAPHALSQRLLFAVGGAIAYLHPHLRLSPFPISWGDELKRGYFRQIAISARQDGVSRTQLAKKAWRVYLWLLENDRGWMDDNYPNESRTRLSRARS